MAGQTFHSLHVRNYRLYFTAQLISVSGTWMQTVAQAWLVLRLAPPRVARGSTSGFVTALQFVPMLLFGTWGGLIADRFDKRRVLFGTQASAGVLALVLGLLTATHAVRLWEVFVIALLLGFVNMVDNPARQSFVVEMVGRDDLTNAVSLNSVVMNSARMIGPAIGGVLIALVGLAVCFEVNAASYVGRHHRPRADEPSRVASQRAGASGRQGPTAGRVSLRRGARRGCVTRLVLVAVVGTLAYNFQVVLALLAKFTFHGGAGVYSGLTSLMGGGAVMGGLVIATSQQPEHPSLDCRWRRLRVPYSRAWRCRPHCPSPWW